MDRGFTLPLQKMKKIKKVSKSGNITRLISYMPHKVNLIYIYNYITIVLGYLSSVKSRIDDLVAPQGHQGFKSLPQRWGTFNGGDVNA